MNVITNSARGFAPAANRYPTQLLQGARENFAASKIALARAPRKTPGLPAADGKVTTRVPYASALYAAAIAALLSACAQSDVTAVPEAAIVQPTGPSVEASADLPTVVITASRERSKAIG